MRRPGCGADYERARARLLATHPDRVCCGAPADTADHVPPLCEAPPGQWHGRLVPACRRCNQRRGGWRLVNQPTNAHPTTTPWPNTTTVLAGHLIEHGPTDTSPSRQAPSSYAPHANPNASSWPGADA